MRVELRDWKKKDLNLYTEWSKPGHKWQEFDGPYYKRSFEKLESNIAKLEEKIINQGFSYPRARQVISLKETDDFIGTVSCYWESIETNWLCAGISLYDEKYWGKGLGYEALGLWVDYLFESYPDIIRLDLRTWSGNMGMIKLAEKLGFKLEARFRKARIVNGEYFDSLGYGVLKDEWLDSFPEGFAGLISDKGRLKK